MSANETDVEDMVVEQSAQVPQEVCEALAPQSGHSTPSYCMPVSRTTLNLSSIELQVQFPISQVENLHKEIAKCEAKKDSGAWVIALRTFIQACQPYFSFLESSARTMMLCPDELLEFSQQLCDVLERLVLDSASRNLLTLDQTDPDNMADFCIGQIELQRPRLNVKMFRYCKPTPYVTTGNTGVFKRMRWNVERFDDGHTKYYYLCYEDTKMPPDRDEYAVVVRMWSIGQWVQVKPDPNTESIGDWVFCDIPEGAFDQLLLLGIHEPPSRIATNHFLNLLMSQEGISP